MAAPIRLSSPLSRSACAETLREAVDAPLVMFGKKPVIGSVGDHKATLRRRISGRNSFQTALRVALEDVSTGTLLECRSGMHPAVLVFISLWVGIVVIVGGAVFISSVIAVTGAAESEIPPSIGLLAPIAFALFGIALVTIGRKMAGDEEAFLIDFVVRATGATRLAADQPQGGTVT